MTKPTLLYFDFPGGRGEASRLALHLSGVDWIDDRFSGDWPSKKGTTPFGALPVLTIPGKGELSQSNAILEFVGRGHGLLPSDPFEAARHVAVMNAVEELRAEAGKTGVKDEDEKKALRDAFVAGYLARWAANCEAQVQGPFVGGDELSVADLKLFVALSSYTRGVYDHIPADVFDGYPKLTALLAAVAAHPGVAAWYARG